MTFNDMIYGDCLLKIKPDLPVHVFMTISKCGLFDHVGNSHIDNMCKFTINKVCKRKLKINKLLNKETNNFKNIETLLNNNSDNLQYGKDFL